MLQSGQWLGATLNVEDWSDSELSGATFEHCVGPASGCRIRNTRLGFGRSCDRYLEDELSSGCALLSVLMLSVPDAAKTQRFPYKQPCAENRAQSVEAPKLMGNVRKMRRVKQRELDEERAGEELLAVEREVRQFTFVP